MSMNVWSGICIFIAISIQKSIYFCFHWIFQYYTCFFFSFWFLLFCFLFMCGFVVHAILIALKFPLFVYSLCTLATAVYPTANIQQYFVFVIFQILFSLFLSLSGFHNFSKLIFIFVVVSMLLFYSSLYFGSL